MPPQRTGHAHGQEIQILHEFRDEYLLTNPLRQAYIDFYYKINPPVAEFIAEHPSVNPIARAGLLLAVAMSAKAVSTAPVEKIVLVGLLSLISVALAVGARRRRGKGLEDSPG